MLKPLSTEKWNYTTAAHLLNRAGFSGTPAEIEQLTKILPSAAVNQLVDYEKIPDPTVYPDWAHPDPARAERLRAIQQATGDEKQQLQKDERQMQVQQMQELRGWWLQRMATGPRPLQEKMVLFWHGHFATSMEKVRDTYLMWRQNELFRRLALDNWSRILVEVATDPAMLVWLDQAQSRKDHPNENFAREVMELFTLGEGHYTETDITEGARALTGWSYDRESEKFVERPNIHDQGTKTFLGRAGNFNGSDILEQIVAQPQAARFITAKLWIFFAGSPPSEDLNTALAAKFREGNNYFRPFLRTMFLAEEFYSPKIIHNQVKSPVEWLVGSCRVLERELPPPLVSAALTRNLGQDLFAPPNVKGWDGGLSWITTNNLLARYNQADTLVQGDVAPLENANVANKPAQDRQIERRLHNIRLNSADVAKLFTDQERSDKALLIAALEKRFLQASLSDKQEHTLRDYLDAHANPDDNDIRGAIRLIMSTPDFQLC
ncbi:MAG TPA: DUF1800 domain-containing protein [Verrucomicrobiae bacterium]|nr:DUF1800 domain-containing protein [Verrucomicrobiae bacterium]